MRFLRFTCLLLSSLAIAAPVSAQGAGWNVIKPVVEIDSIKELLLLSPDGRMIFETNLHFGQVPLEHRLVLSSSRDVGQGIAAKVDW